MYVIQIGHSCTRERSLLLIDPGDMIMLSHGNINLPAVDVYITDSKSDALQVYGKLLTQFEV